jgi:ribose 5-phosphate isomerase A
MLAFPMSDDGSPIWPIATEAAAMVEAGMVVGLGTGRAAAMFVRALAARVRSGLSIRGVPTSTRTARLAEELAVPLATLDEVQRIDVDVDGADEVDPALDLIKGHGGALLRERVVASISERFIVLVGEEKLVPRLGTRMSVPVEVVPFAAPVARRALEAMGCEVALRMTGAEPFVSDNGNPILDARFREIADARELHERMDRLPGVVDNGLFVGMADVVLVHSDGARRRLSRS